MNRAEDRKGIRRRIAKVLIGALLGLQAQGKIPDLLRDDGSIAEEGVVGWGFNVDVVCEEGLPGIGAVKNLVLIRRGLINHQDILPTIGGPHVLGDDKPRPLRREPRRRVHHVLHTVQDPKSTDRTVGVGDGTTDSDVHRQMAIDSMFMGWKLPFTSPSTMTTSKGSLQPFWPLRSRRNGKGKKRRESSCDCVKR
jgi:hypothetical protein